MSLEGSMSVLDTRNEIFSETLRYEGLRRPPI